MLNARQRSQLADVSTAKAGLTSEFFTSDAIFAEERTTLLPCGGHTVPDIDLEWGEVHLPRHAGTDRSQPRKSPALIS